MRRMRAVDARCRIHRQRRWSAFAIAAVSGCSVFNTSMLAQERTVLVGATLLDGRGGEPLPASRVMIENGRFTCVSGPEGCPSLPSDRLIDLRGKWLSPGLIDTHVHLPMVLAPDGLRRLQRLRFAFGITTVRDAGSRATDSLLAARALAEAGDAPTPRLVVAALIHDDDAIPLGVPRDSGLVAVLVKRGVEAIKIKEPFDKENWRSEIRAARAAGVPSFGHTWGGVHEEFTRAAVAEGISGISHIMAIPIGTQPIGTVLTPPDSARDFWPWEKRLWLTMDKARRDTLLREMIAANVWLEPTLVTEYHFGRALTRPAAAYFLGAVPSTREWFTQWMRTVRGAAPVRDTVVPPRYPETWQQQSALVGDFIRGGGMVIAGADGKAPAIDLHEEMRLIGEVAGAPMTGLLAATRNAAIALGRGDLGTIETGKLADAVVFDENPLGDVGSSLRIASVIKGGVMHDAERVRAEFRDEYRQKVWQAWRGRLVRVVPVLALMGVAFLTVWWRIRRRRTTR